MELCKAKRATVVSNGTNEKIKRMKECLLRINIFFNHYQEKYKKEEK